MQQVHHQAAGGLRQAADAGQVARKVRKFPWEAHEALLVHCLLKALKGHYAQTAVIATCTASLARYHPSLSIHLTDVLLEQVRLALGQHRCELPWSSSTVGVGPGLESIHMCAPRNRAMLLVELLTDSPRPELLCPCFLCLMSSSWCVARSGSC